MADKLWVVVVFELSKVKYQVTKVSVCWWELSMDWHAWCLVLGSRPTCGQKIVQALVEDKR